MLQTFGLVYGMVQRFSQKFPVSFSAVSVTLRCVLALEEKIVGQANILHTALNSLIWFLWDAKEPRPLLEKSRGLRPRRCGQPFLGWVGYL